MELPAATELTIQHAAALRESWLAALAAAPAEDAVLDLASTHEIDSAGVQLLMALRHELQRQGRRLHLKAAGAVAREALQTLGAAAGFEPAAAGPGAAR